MCPCNQEPKPGSKRYCLMYPMVALQMYTQLKRDEGERERNTFLEGIESKEVFTYKFT